LAGAAVLALLVAFATPAQARSDAVSPGPVQAVAYQISVAHDGFSGDTTIKPPLRSRWTHQFTGPVSYPLIAEGKVYVTVADNVSTPGTSLYALDQASGAIVWSQPISGSFLWSNAAYDDGHVFVVNFDGLLREFDASTGAPGWSVQLFGQNEFTSPPTADNGIVYTAGAGSAGTLYAVSETDGSVLWTQLVQNGDHSSPALSATDVYASYSCGLVHAFDRTTGQQQWFSDGPCGGAGGTTPVYHDGRVYTRDFTIGNNKILDAGTGTLLGTFEAGPAPAFADKVRLFLNAGTLQAVSGSRTLWTFTGDGGLVTAPIVVGTTAYIGSSSGMIYGLSVKSGEVLWSANAGAAVSRPDEQSISPPLAGLGAGQGLLVVPAGNELAAYSD
jgi:outer membrane protein assembly factor BamB